MADDKVVYLKGTGPAPVDEKKASSSALRSTFLDALKDYRAGKCRAVVILTLEENDAISWRIGGDFSTGEIVAALEISKLQLVMND
jgi:hypothetical protein